MTRLRYLIILFFVLGLFSSCSEKAQTEKLFKYFLEKHVERIKPVQKQLNETIWATYSGQKSFNELQQESERTDSVYLSGSDASGYYQNLLNSFYDNTSEFEILKNIGESGLITDQSLKRQFYKVFRDYQYIQNNWEEAEHRSTELLDKFFEIKKRENTFFDSLVNEPASERNKKWINEFSSLVVDFREMIKALNHDAKSMGYKSYFDYAMDIQEISPSWLDSMLVEVERITRDDYSNLLAVCRSGKCRGGCAPARILTPFQFRCAHSRMIYPSEWNGIQYSREDYINLLSDYFALGGFDIKNIYAKSDIWYDKKKINNSFFFCVDFDNADLRIYSNNEPSVHSLNSLIHEFSHALHYQSIDKDLPYLLRKPHNIISEGTALYLDEKIYTSEKIQSKMKLPLLNEDPFFKDFTNPSALMLLRKLLRTIYFEEAIYENPDQDFNELWWKLNKDFLFIDPAPEDRLPEWITSLHIVGSVGIYVDYLFAIVFAAQLEHYYPEDQFALIKSKVMKYGDSLPWYELIKSSTGEPLNLTYLQSSYKRPPLPVPVAENIKDNI